MCTHVISNQPVWDQIATQRPDILVLLGDSIYLDINNDHPQYLDDDAFGQRLHTRYLELISQPQFRALIEQLGPGKTFTVWDDHDFLWDDAPGALWREVPMQRDKIRISTAFHEAFRRALSLGLSQGSFPLDYQAPIFWDLKQGNLLTESVRLNHQLMLHLCDVRSFRTVTSFTLPEADRTILGSAQKLRIASQIQASPADTIHLIASGSTIKDWKNFRFDFEWLLELASQHQIIVLSGDIHRNSVDAFYTGGLPLHEVTSSGAAVRDAVSLGQLQQNYGVLEVGADSTSVRLFHFGVQERIFDRKYSHATWLPV